MQFLFGVVIPYAALAAFLFGLVRKVLWWARSPVPYHIALSGGQQRSLPWIRQSKLDNPSGTAGVIGRVAMEALFFRSLIRNNTTERREGGELSYHWQKWLWIFSLMFHWSMAVVVFRHLRFFLDPVPGLVNGVEALDGFFQIGLPTLYITDVTLLVGISYLFLRRVLNDRLRYISLPTDYILPLLILGVGGSGVLMRYFLKVDIPSVKQLAMGLVTFNPVVPEGIGGIFYVHITLVSLLIAYLPFSKLVHMVGIFFSPTRNLANNSRAVRHVNPWNPKPPVHTYQEYEDEFRDKMVQAGLPVEKES